MTLRKQWGLGLILAIELGLLGFGYRIADRVERRYLESAEASLRETAQQVAGLFATEPAGGDLQPSEVEARLDSLVQYVPDLRIVVADRHGGIVYDSTGCDPSRNLSAQRKVRLVLAGSSAAHIPCVPEAKNPLPVSVIAPILAQGHRIGTVGVGRQPGAEPPPVIEEVRGDFLLIGIVAGVAVLVLIVGLTVWWVRPFHLVAEYFRLVRNRQYPERPCLRRTRLGVIGAVLDEMCHAVAGRRYVENYVETLTHEIKSPLSAIRAGAELLESPMPAAQRDRFLTDIREQADRIQEIVDRLLELAALENRNGLVIREPVDLAELIRKATDSLSVEARARDLDIQIRVAPNRIVEGDRFLLLRALTNLLRNALEFSPAGRRIDVALGESGRYYEVSFRDQGPGIPSYAEKRVFERFYSLPRPSTNKRSTGLGLSFVQEIAELHHGQVDLANQPEGGAVARLRLPKAAGPKLLGLFG